MNVRSKAFFEGAHILNYRSLNCARYTAKGHKLGFYICAGYCRCRGTACRAPRPDQSGINITNCPLARYSNMEQNPNKIKQSVVNLIEVKNIRGRYAF